MHKNEFWRTLFEAEKLATKLKDAANAKDDGIAVQTQEYGKIQVKAKSATESGENFLSDAYIVRAILLESGDEHQAFVKVYLLTSY